MRFLTGVAELAGGQGLAVYGSGKQGVAFRRYLERYAPGVRVACFVDSFVRGEKDGLPVLHVDDLSGRPELTVVVASAFYPAIGAELERRGIRDALVLHPAVNPGQYYWAEERRDLDQTLRAAEAVFHDPRDRELFRRVVDFRTVTPDLIRSLAGGGAGPTLAPWPPGGRMYLDFLEGVRFRVVLEGGAYDGTNSLDFLERMTPDGRLFAFEPFPRFLVQGPHAARLAADPRFTLVPGGLWEADGESWLRLDGEASRVESGAGEEPPAPDRVRVPLHSVDGFVRDQGLDGLDLIKLDVENAELPVLRGAADSLGRFRPCLAVCLYHSKADLYEIPLHLSRTLTGYRFRLAHYGHGLLDTVLYALPEERAAQSAG